MKWRHTRPTRIKWKSCTFLLFVPFQYIASNIFTLSLVMIMLVCAPSNPHKIAKIHLKAHVNSVSPYLWSTRLICVSRDFPLSKGSTRYRDARTIAVTPLEGGAPEWLMDVDTRAHTPPARSRSVHDLANKKRYYTSTATIIWSLRKDNGGKFLVNQSSVNFNWKYVYYTLAVHSQLDAPHKR